MFWLTVPDNSTVPDPTLFGDAFSLVRFFFRMKVPELFNVAPLLITKLSIDTIVVPTKTLRVVPVVITFSALVDGKSRKRDRMTANMGSGTIFTEK